MKKPHEDDRLVQKLVERGTDMTLKDVVESTRYCEMNSCGLFGAPPGWKELFEPLREAIGKSYPGEVSWDVIYCLQKGDHANEIVSSEIKAKYIRIMLFSRKSVAQELQKSFYEHFGQTPEEPTVNNNS